MSDSTGLREAIFLIRFSAWISTHRDKHVSLTETDLYFSGFPGFVSVLRN